MQTEHPNKQEGITNVSDQTHWLLQDAECNKWTTVQVNAKNMTRKLFDTDTVGKTGINLGTLEFQAETDMGTALLPTAYLSGTWLSQKTSSPSFTRIH